MNNRRERAEIAQAAIDILERGNYQNRSGMTIDLTEAIALSESRSIHYLADSFDREFTDAIETPNNFTPSADRSNLGTDRSDDAELVFGISE